MTEMYATNTVTVIGGAAEDGDTDLYALLLTKTPNNTSHVCVLDSLTWAYTNTSGSAVTLRLDVLPASASAAQWQALVTVPAGETATIDKNFVHGMPLWKGTLVQQGSSAEEARGEYTATTGAALGGAGSGVYAGSVRPYVDGIPWHTDTPHGPGILSVTYHMEPASQRRY